MNTYLKHILFVAVVLVLASCTHGNQPKTGTKEPVQQSTADIAKNIWKVLTEEDPLISGNVAAAQGFELWEEEPQSDMEYMSDTHLKFYRMGDVSEGQIDQVAYYEMQCYPMNDGSWMAVVYGFFNNYCNYGEYLTGLYAYHYKDGKLLNDNPPIDLPAECPQSAMSSLVDKPWMRCVVNFDDAGFEMIPFKFWPIRYNWTGEKFEKDPHSAVVANDFENGDLYPYDFSRRNTSALDYYPFEVGPNYLIMNGDTGEEVLQLEFEDEHLSVINILSPKIGIAFAADMMTSPYTDYYLYYYTSKPVALGQPIKNVLESDKYEALQREIAESTKDGLYTLTQHIKVDKTNHKDIYAEYQAKDKDSNIERFRIIGLPLAISLESELEANTEITDDVKQVWALINADDAIVKDMPGSFKKFWDTDENGFAAIFREENDRGGYVDWKLTYAMLTANDGRQIAYIWKSFYDRAYADKPQPLTPEWAQFICQNSQVQQVEPQIPMPQLTDFPAYNLGDQTVSMDGENADMSLDCNGSFRFFAHSDHYSSFGDGEDDAHVKYYLIFFRWDGDKYVCEKTVD